MMDVYMLDRNEIAMRLATSALKKIADTSIKDGQMISAYQMLAQVTLAQINALLDFPIPPPSDDGEMMEMMD